MKLPSFFTAACTLVWLALPLACSEQAPAAEAVVRREVVVYGGTPAGVMAAIAAARQGHTVALLDLNAHVGGVVSDGLVASDMGNRKTVGGLADDFFKRIVKFYADKNRARRSRPPAPASSRRSRAQAATWFASRSAPRRRRPRTHPSPSATPAARRSSRWASARRRRASTSSGSASLPSRPATAASSRSATPSTNGRVAIDGARWVWLGE